MVSRNANIRDLDIAVIASPLNKDLKNVAYNSYIVFSFDGDDKDELVFVLAIERLEDHVRWFNLVELVYSVLFPVDFYSVWVHRLAYFAEGLLEAVKLGSRVSAAFS